jgi:hypothetical protein
VSIEHRSELNPGQNVSEFIHYVALPHLQKAEAVTDRQLDFSTFPGSRVCI